MNMNDYMLENLYLGQEGAAESGSYGLWARLFKYLDLFEN